MTIRNIYLDYNAIALRLDGLAPELCRAGFDGLVIILRGGTFAGMHMAFLTNLPCHFLRYDRKSATPEWVGPPPSPGRVLLCEDFAGMGQTLINCRRFLEDGGYRVATLVVCKDQLSASQPDYYCFESQESGARFLLPWERYRINPATGHTSQVDAPPDHEFERTAWDMDGVFLVDVDPRHYEEDLEAALCLRDETQPAPYAPKLAVQDLIITGRPVCDKERTLAWLQTHGFPAKVVFRDDDLSKPTTESVATWKGRRALELGCTHFVESDPGQALHMAARYPELRVIWWNQGSPLVVQAGAGSVRAGSAH